MNEYIRVPGYAYPIGKRFDPSLIDVSSGEPIVRTKDGFWVWGRGCTQPGGGIVPAWGFVRESGAGASQTGAGASPPGLGASNSSQSIVPALIIGGAVLAGLVAVVALGTRERKKTVDEEAHDLFPPPHGRAGTRAPAGRRAVAFRAAAGRCFYKELRQDHSPDVAARIAQTAVRREHGWLTGLSRAGATPSEGCTLLRRHAPHIYQH
jgi:hypothetical protein